MSPKTRFFGQIGLGLTLRPLRITHDCSRRQRPALGSDSNSSGRHRSSSITSTVGAEVGGRVDVLRHAALRAVPERAPIPRPAGVGASATSTPFALMDTRLDVRGLVYRTDDKKWLFGAGMSFFIPTGSQFSYGGDGALSTALNVSVETYVRDHHPRR